MDEVTEAAPPCYADLTHDSPDSGGFLEDQVVVLLEEVDEAISRSAPQSEISRSDMRTIQRLAESILKRNVTEQGVLPTALQREITIAHVVTNFDKTKVQTATTSFTVPPTNTERTIPANKQSSRQSAVSQPCQNRQTSKQSAASQPCQNRQSSTQSATTQPRQNKQRVEVGVWTTIGSSIENPHHVIAYADQIPKAISCMVVWLIVTFFIGSPISLFWTIPALYWIIKANKNVEQDNIPQAKKNFQRYICLGVIFNLIWSVFFFSCLLVVVIVSVVVLTSSSRSS